MDEFIIQLLAKLDTSQVIKDYNALKQQLEKQINIRINFNTSNANDISKLAEQLQSALSKASDGKLNLDTTQITSALEQIVKNAQQTGQQIGKQIQNGINTEIERVQLKAETLKSKLEEFSQKNYGFSTWEKDINGVTISFESLISSLNAVKSIDNLNVITDQANALKSSFLVVKANADALRTEISDLNKSAQQANKIQLSIETGAYESKVESLIAKTQQWTDVNGNARISTTALSTALNELTTASQAYANNPTEATQKRLIESSEKLDVEYKKITNSVRSMNAEMAKDSAIASLHNKVLDFMSKNGKAVKYSGEFKRIFDTTAQGAELTKQKVTELNQEFNNAVMSARNAGKLGKTFFQTLREGMQSFSYWTSSTFIVMKIIQSIKGGISSVKALDTALVDLKKTTTMTSSELEDFYYDSNKVAKQMGVTTEEIINQASAWSRLNKMGLLCGDV